MAYDLIMDFKLKSFCRVRSYYLHTPEREEVHRNLYLLFAVVQMNCGYNEILYCFSLFGYVMATKD